jgi:Domain of unknown function (DUF4383)
MSLLQRFVQAFGAIYLLVEIIGFAPPSLLVSLSGAIGPFAELLIGLFIVNWSHSLAHLAIGAAGLAVHKSFSDSKAYALALNPSGPSLAARKLRLLLQVGFYLF